MRKILNDPQHARDKSQMLAEFGMTARAVKNRTAGSTCSGRTRNACS